MEAYHLKANTRKITKKKVDQLRKKGIIPGIVYGHRAAPQIIELNRLNFEKIYQETGSSNLVDLVIDSKKPVKVLVQDVQLHPLTNDYTHVDFHQVRMTEKITTNVELEFIGESPAVKELGGVLVKSLSEIEIECLPGDLISEIKVDISKLKTFDDIIYVKELPVPANIKVLNDPGEAVTLVSEPRKEEEIKPATEEEETEEPAEEGEEAATEEKTEDQGGKQTEQKPIEDKKDNK